MFHRPRLLPSFLAVAALVGVMSQAASCTLDQLGTTRAETGEACGEDSNCDDENKCTVNSCGPTKICVYTPVDGLAPEQKAGDCKQGTCNDGNFTEVNDDTDIPDDLETCTMDGWQG